MQIINLDICKKTDIPAIHAKQLDSGRKFKAVLTDCGDAYAIPAGAAFSLWYSGTAGAGNYTTVDGRSAFSVEGDTVTVELSPVMLAHSGGGLMSLALNDSSGNQLGLWDILYFVEALPGAQSQQAQPYFAAFAETVAQALNASREATDAAAHFVLDPTLSEVDQPAQAAAVGAALQGKAPAGFGLGGAQRISYADIDSIREPGWYYMSDLALDFGSAQWTDAYMRVDAYNYTNAAQTLYIIGASHTTLQRFLQAQVWGAWDYVRSNMSIGVEYRLPYLWGGKQVYAKLYKVTYAAAGSYVTINLNDDIGATVYPITVIGRDKNRTLSYGYLNTNYIHITSGTGSVRIETKSTYGGASAKPTICVIYTKEWEG